MTTNMKKIVLFASGSGSNVENIIQHFSSNPEVEVVSVFCNNPAAGVIERVRKRNIPVRIFSPEELKSGLVTMQLEYLAPDLIVLAGFLLKLPGAFVKTFANRIINIHPALLPKHGGKGMYGNFVHQAVLDNREKVTGITIHYVNEEYDKGAVIYQHEVAIEDCGTCQEIAERVQILEHKYFPLVIEKILLKKATVE